MTFKDHFSGHSDRYQAHRPTYPEALYDYLGSLAPGHGLAWDCATGNGQAAHGLVPHFRTVVATDASAAQVAQARPHERIAYLVAPAERTPIPDGTVDLVTVAQALHWLDLDRFYAEVRRACRPGAVLACWCYQLHAIDPGVDAVVGCYYAEVVGAYWPPERLLVEAGYRTLPLPFEELTPPPFRMVQRWDLDRLLGYLGRRGLVLRPAVIDRAWGTEHKQANAVVPPTGAGNRVFRCGSSPYTKPPTRP
ncbi:class I SAM-dependent methyltransferase [Tautonia plasticadhaerens]|uniref:Methyltransferase domain protein n=1 Tax=Tautonia plasticadhaerens TaxID=2527974 RepID=A0A518H4B1_9BACT|nr:class I SAM-dependent methyltransferase [Tautonia plasticadhaerens]QDV35673.1 Methyltransferase domain protein [Tautonia plasticadhaerens]